MMDKVDILSNKIPSEREKLVADLESLANVCVMIVNGENSNTAVFRQLAEDKDNIEAQEILKRYEIFDADLKKAVRIVLFTSEEQDVLRAQNRVRHGVEATFKMMTAFKENLPVSQEKEGEVMPLSQSGLYDQISIDLLKQIVGKVERVKQILKEKYSEGSFGDI